MNRYSVLVPLLCFNQSKRNTYRTIHLQARTHEKWFARTWFQIFKLILAHLCKLSFSSSEPAFSPTTFYYFDQFVVSFSQANGIGAVPKDHVVSIHWESYPKCYLIQQVLLDSLSTYLIWEAKPNGGTKPMHACFLFDTIMRH